MGGFMTSPSDIQRIASGTDRDTLKSALDWSTLPDGWRYLNGKANPGVTHHQHGAGGLTLTVQNSGDGYISGARGNGAFAPVGVYRRFVPSGPFTVTAKFDNFSGHSALTAGYWKGGLLHVIDAAHVHGAFAESILYYYGASGGYTPGTAGNKWVFVKACKPRGQLSSSYQHDADADTLSESTWNGPIWLRYHYDPGPPGKYQTWWSTDGTNFTEFGGPTSGGNSVQECRKGLQDFESSQSEIGITGNHIFMIYCGISGATAQIAWRLVSFEVT